MPDIIAQTSLSDLARFSWILGMENSRSRGDRYALAALKNERWTIASEIMALERQIRARKDALSHVDACLRILDPSIEVSDIPRKRPPKHINLFR